jgi:hypothetical protein
VAPSIRKKLALTSLTSGGRSVGIVRLRTEAMEFFYISITFGQLLSLVVCLVSSFVTFFRGTIVHKKGSNQSDMTFVCQETSLSQNTRIGKVTFPAYVNTVLSMGRIYEFFFAYTFLNE